MMKPPTADNGWSRWRGEVNTRLSHVERDLGTIRKFAFWFVTLLVGVLVVNLLQLTLDRCDLHATGTAGRPGISARAPVAE